MRHTKQHTTPTNTEKTLLQESYMSITYNESDNWLYVKWMGKRTKENMLAGTAHMLKYIKETGVHKVINDSMEFTQAWPNIVEWVADEFAIQLQEAGVQYFAWIFDDKNLTKAPADAILKREKSDIIVMVFDKVPTAEIWLRSLH